MSGPVRIHFNALPEDVRQSVVDMIDGDHPPDPIASSPAHFKRERFWLLMGIVLTADGVAEALVPMAVATIRDETGSYTLGFALLVTLAALGALAVAFLPGRRRDE